MSFSNAPVDPASLPALDEAPLAPVSRRFAPYLVLGLLARWLPAALVVGLLPEPTNLPSGAMPGLASLIAAAGLAFALLAWREARSRAFGLREHDLIYRSGLLIQRTTVLPLARIQHVETASGPLERAFNLVRLNCYTAGGASADLVVEGLERELADRVRQWLLTRIPEQEPGNGRDV